MKLILAIISSDDSMAATSALTKEGFFVTKLSTTGGFLQAGNTTLLIGTDDDKLEGIKTILQKYCHTRKQIVTTKKSCGRGLLHDETMEEATVGGAVVFTLGVESFDRL